MSYPVPGDNQFIPSNDRGPQVVFRRYEAGNPVALAEAEKDAAEHPQDTYVLVPYDGPIITNKYVTLTPVMKVKENEP